MEVLPKPAWMYQAVLIRVVDGDTLLVDLDLGFHLTQRVKVRLAGLDAPEMGTAEGVLLKQTLEGRMKSGDPMVVFSRALDKYGRVLGSVYHQAFLAESQNGCLNSWLVNGGMAKPVATLLK